MNLDQATIVGTIQKNLNNLKLLETPVNHPVDH